MHVKAFRNALKKAHSNGLSSDFVIALPRRSEKRALFGWLWFGFGHGFCACCANCHATIGKFDLKRGYAVVRGDGAVVTTQKAAQAATALEIEFADGRMTVGAAGAKPVTKSKPKPPDQGSLF